MQRSHNIVYLRSKWTFARNTLAMHFFSDYHMTEMETLLVLFYIEGSAQVWV